MALVAIGILATPLALARLVRGVGRDPWLGRLGFPLMGCFNFYMGFVNFVLSTPLVLLVLSQVLGFVQRPSRGRAVGESRGSR